MSTIQNKKIVAKEYPLKDILSNNKYSIDYFQREYRWRKENIDQLIIFLLLSAKTKMSRKSCSQCR